MLKLTLVSIILLISVIALTTASPVSVENDFSDDEISPEVYEAALLAYKRGQVAKMILDEAQFEPEVERLEKRFPKWRTGDTKSRVDQLKYNRHQPSSAWANSMIEKNKLYEKMHG